MAVSGVAIPDEVVFPVVVARASDEVQAAEVEAVGKGSGVGGIAAVAVVAVIKNAPVGAGDFVSRPAVQVERTSGGGLLAHFDIEFFVRVGIGGVQLVSLVEERVFAVEFEPCRPLAGAALVAGKGIKRQGAVI